MIFTEGNDEGQGRSVGADDQVDADAKGVQGVCALGQGREAMQAEGVPVSREEIKGKTVCFDSVIQEAET